jgi:hypothetical protein
LDLDADRVIPKEMGIELARCYGIGFLEISAKMKMNTEDALMALAVIIELFPLVCDDIVTVVRDKTMSLCGPNTLCVECIVLPQTFFYTLNSILLDNKNGDNIPRRLSTR